MWTILPKPGHAILDPSTLFIWLDSKFSPLQKSQSVARRTTVDVLFSWWKYSQNSANVFFRESHNFWVTSSTSLPTTGWRTSMRNGVVSFQFTFTCLELSLISSNSSLKFFDVQKAPLNDWIEASTRLQVPPLSYSVKQQDNPSWWLPFPDCFMQRKTVNLKMIVVANKWNTV